MKEIARCVFGQAFMEQGGQYFGMYNDMHMVLKEVGGFVCAYLFLDLPPEGRKARRELESLMNENAQRYDAQVAQDQSQKGFLKIEIKKDEHAGINLDRFLTNCDLLLRPYGREMGLLCAYCRREMQEIKPEYKMENGLIVPVCPDCINLESADKAKKADNRRTIEKKRMERGVVGAAIGSLISIALWAVIEMGGGLLAGIAAALISVFLIKWMFEKMSKTPNRLTAVTVLCFAMFALVAGSAIGYTVRTNEYNEYMRETVNYSINFALEEGDSFDESLIDAYERGEYDDISILDAFNDPKFYQGMIMPAAAVLFVSLGADSIRLKSRKRR